MGEVFGTVVMSLVVFILLGAFPFILLRDRARSKKWRAAAEGLGFTYTAADENLVEELLELQIALRYPLFRYRADNVLQGLRGGSEVTLADFSFRPHRGAATVWSLCLLRFHQSGSPDFRLIEKLPKNASTGSIEFFQEDQGFATSFVLHGQDEQRLRHLFDATMRAQFMQFRGSGLSLTLSGNVLVLHFRRQLKPAEVAQLVEQAFWFLQRLVPVAGRRSGAP